jgi:hypothetical protein
MSKKLNKTLKYLFEENTDGVALLSWDLLSFL